MARIATVEGKLELRIGDAEPISLGRVTIPIEATAERTGTDGSLILTATPNMREVREFIEQVFHRA